MKYEDWISFKDDKTYSPKNVIFSPKKVILVTQVPEDVILTIDIINPEDFKSPDW